MKKIFLFISLLSCLVGAAQLPTYPGYTNINSKNQYIGVIANQRLSPPSDTTTQKYGLALLNGVFYTGNGTYWTAITAGSTYTGSKSVLLTGNDFTLVNDSTDLTGVKIYGFDGGIRGWKIPSLYIPNGELAGDAIVALGNSKDFTNQHTSATYADGLAAPGMCPVTWVADSTYHVGVPCSYYIGGVPHTSAGGDIKVKSDPTFDKQYAVVVNTSNLPDTVGGSAQANPEVPTVGSDQFFLTSIYVNAGNAANTSQVGQRIVWNETFSSGAQYYYPTQTATIDSVYTGIAPYNGTYSTRLTVAGNGAYFQWNAPYNVTQSKAAYSNLIIYMYNVSAFANTRNFNITLRLNGVQVPGSNAVSPTAWGYTKSAIGSWQIINIPMSAFGGGDAFNQIRVTNTGTGGTLNVLFDYVQFQTGIVVPTPSGTLQDRYGLQDSSYASNRRNNVNSFAHRLVNVGTYEIRGKSVASDSTFMVLASDGSSILRVATNGSIVYMSQFYGGNNFLVTAGGANVLNGAYFALNGGSEIQGYQQAVKLTRRWVDAGSDVNTGVKVDNSTEITFPGVIDSLLYKPLSVGFRSIETGVYNEKFNVYADGHLKLFDGPTFTGTPSGGVYLGAVSGELLVKDASGNTTTLSPHNPMGLPYKLKKLGWTYHSENSGNYITVDMLKQAETVERLTKEIEELKAIIYKSYKKKPATKLIYKGKTK